MATGKMTDKTPIQLYMAEAKRRKRGNKYGAKMTEVDGIKFHSKAESEYYKILRIDQANGGILRFHRQVIFDLPGGVKYLCDFMILENDGRIRYVDVKGHETKEFITKKKMVEAIYGVEIELKK